MLQAQDALSAGSFDTSITWGACARQGPRATMEDRHVGLICLPHCAAFFGVSSDQLCTLGLAISTCVLTSALAASSRSFAQAYCHLLPTITKPR